MRGEGVQPSPLFQFVAGFVLWIVERRVHKLRSVQGYLRGHFAQWQEAGGMGAFGQCARVQIRAKRL